MADILHFSGLLQSRTSSFLRRDDQLERAVNIHGDNIGSLTKRLGYSRYGDAFSAGNIVRGLHEYHQLSTGNRRLFGFSNGTIGYQNAGPWTTVQSGLTANANAKFRVFLDQLFVCGVDTNGNFLTTANIAGTTYSTVTNVTSAPQAAFSEVFQDQLYLANVQVAGVRHRSRFYYSSIPDSAGTTITWPTTNFEPVYTNNGEELTGIHTNKSLNELLLFKTSSLHAWDNFRIRDIANIGTTSHESIQTVNGATYFYHAGKGIYRYQGTRPVLISRPIEQWIAGISDTTIAFGVNEEDKYYLLFVGDIVVEGTTYTNCAIRYSVLDNTFTIYSYFDTFRVFANHTVSGTTRVYGGAEDGDVHQFARGTDTVFADDGNAIHAEFLTKAYDLFLPSSKKFADRVVIYTTQAQSLTGRIRERGQDFSTYFSITKPEEIVSVNPAQSHFLQFHFSESSTHAPFQMEGISFDPIRTTVYA